MILDFQTGIIFIEVKLRSGNKVKSPDYLNWQKYLEGTDAFASASEVKATGLYELARNWRLAWEMAKQRPLSLVNLGPEDLFVGENRAPLNQFSGSLNQNEKRRFIEATWGDFLGPLNKHPEWLRSYITQRRILSRTGT